jgi:hypothetical protein
MRVARPWGLLILTANLDTGSGAPLPMFPRFITFALQYEEVRPRMNMLEM